MLFSPVRLIISLLLSFLQLNQHSGKPLSWVRLRDEHIIAVDHTTFINDARFASLLQSAATATSATTAVGAPPPSLRDPSDATIHLNGSSYDVLAGSEAMAVA